MPDKHLYEYAVIRIVPRVEREEFINAGIIMYCAAQRFLEVQYQVNAARLDALGCKYITAEVEARLKAFEQVCKGGKAGGSIGLLLPASRFRWLTAARSTIVQTSGVHPGLCNNTMETLHALYRQLVE